MTIEREISFEWVNGQRFIDLRKPLEQALRAAFTRCEFEDLSLGVEHVIWECLEAPPERPHDKVMHLLAFGRSAQDEAEIVAGC